MSEIPSDLYYTADHEWVRRTGDDTVRVGITDYAQAALGDVVFVELPDVDAEVTAGNEFGDRGVDQVELGPLRADHRESRCSQRRSGRHSPELVNSDPYGGGWLIDLQVDAASLSEALGGSARRRRATAPLSTNEEFRSVVDTADLRARGTVVTRRTTRSVAS